MSIVDIHTPVVERKKIILPDGRVMLQTCEQAAKSFSLISGLDNAHTKMQQAKLVAYIEAWPKLWEHLQTRKALRMYLQLTQNENSQKKVQAKLFMIGS